MAAVLGYPDADALMAAVSEAGRRHRLGQRRRLAAAAALAARPGRVRAAPAAAAAGRRPAGDRRPRRLGTGPGGEVEPGVAIVGGEVALTSAAAGGRRLVAAPAPGRGGRRARPARSPGGALHRLADRWPRRPGPLAGRDPRRPWCGCWPPGRPAIDALEALDQQGLLVRLLPEWEAVRNKPQRNAYHRFTVDRHLLEAAANAAALADRVDRPDLLLVGTPPPRHRQGLSRATTPTVGMALVGHDRPPHGVRAGRRRHPGGHGAATTCCCPTPPPAGTSTTRPPSRRWPRRPATARRSSCWRP